MTKKESICHSAPDTRTKLEKFRDRLFPSRYCPPPEPPDFVNWQDCLHGQTISTLDWKDRLRVLFTGIVIINFKTLTEHPVGKTLSSAVCYIGTKKDTKSCNH